MFAPVPALPGVPVTIRRLDDPDLKGQTLSAGGGCPAGRGPASPAADAAVCGRGHCRRAFEPGGLRGNPLRLFGRARQQVRADHVARRVGAKIRTSARRPGAGQCCRPGVRLALLLFGSLAGAGAAAQSGRRAEQGRRSQFFTSTISALLQNDGRFAASEPGLVRDRVVVIGSSAESGNLTGMQRCSAT